MLSQSHAKFLSPVGPDVLVLEAMRAREALTDLYEVQVTAVAETADIEEAAILGKDCAVEVKIDQGRQTWFSGQASSFSYLGINDHVHRFAITLRPTLWFLGYNRRYTIYQNKSVIDILQDVFGRAGLSRVRFEQSGSYPLLEYIVQYDESDLSFVQRLIEHHGLFYWFDHSASGETLVIVDEVASLQPCDPATLPFATRVVGDAGNAQREEVTGWEQSTRVTSHHYAARDFNFEKPRSTLATQNSTGPQRSANVHERYLYPGGYEDEGEGARLAKLRTEYMESSRERFVGQLGSIKCRAGCTLILSEHPHNPYNQKYLALASNWVFSTAGTRSSGGGDWSLDGAVEFQKASVPYRPRLAVRKPRVMGPHTARVVGPPGEEIWSDEHGRVKVSFQWDRESHEDDRSSCWIRVMTPWAGPQRGFFALPRIGDEVLVWFLDGDPDRPIAGGSLFNGDNVSPTLRQTTHMALRSRSTKSGGADQFNELRFEDSTGQERVCLQAEKDMQFLIKNDRIGDIRGHDTNKTRKTRTVSIGASDNLTVGTDRQTTIGENDSLAVGQDRTAIIDLNDDLAVGKNRKVMIGEDDTLEVAGSISLEAGEDIEIKVGASSLRLDKSGTITLKGANLTFEASSSLTIKGMSAKIGATTTVEISGGVKATISGPLVDVKASGISTVSGALVKVG